MEPEDFVYVGSFGSEKMPDRLMLNEQVNQSLKKIAFYLDIFKTAINEKKQFFINNINKINKDVQDSFGFYINQLSAINPFEPITLNSIYTLRNIINDNNFTVNNNVNNLLNTIISSNPTERNNKLLFGITQNNKSVIHNYTISSVISRMPYDIVSQVFKDYNYADEQNIFSYKLYDYFMTNLNILTPQQLSGRFGNTLNYSYNPNNNHLANYIDNHSLIISPNNVKITLNTYQDEIYSSRKNFFDSIAAGFTGSDQYEDKNRIKFRNSIIGKLNAPDQTMLTYHPSFGYSDFQDTKINSLAISVLSDYISTLENDINNDSSLKDKYNNLINAINNYYMIAPAVSIKLDYYKLSIWQPIPPLGYVALGYVFTNDNQDVKPDKSMIKCIPNTCVKSFKRRKWTKDDIVYLYSDLTQKFAFYRNPYLGTCVVVDLNKNVNNNSNIICSMALNENYI